MERNGSINPIQLLATGLITAVAIWCCCGSASATSNTLLINEVEQAEASNTSREFVEVRNISNQDLHVDLYTLEWRSASNATVTTFYKFPAGTIIPANGYYLVVSSTYPDGHPTVTYNASYPVSTGGVLSTNGGVGIRDASGHLIDSVAWGNITASPHPFVEGTAASSLPSGWSLERQVGEGALLDHDNNSVDFALINPPTPTSTAYTPNVPIVSPVTATPKYLEPGATCVITATATQTVDPVTDATIDLTPFGGSATTPLTHTTGASWTGSFTVPAGQTAGPYTLLVRANDSAGKYGVGGVDVFVYPGPPVTVAIARTKAVNTGELLRVRGLVIATRTANAYIVDADGNAGIAVSASTPFSGVPPLQVGQDVTITGTLTQDIWTSSSTGQIIYKGEYVLTTATGTQNDIVINSSGNSLPAAKAVTSDEVLNDDTLQGRLVSVTGLTVQGGASYKVNPVTGDVLTLVDMVSSSAHFYVGVSHNATDQPALPYPGLPTDPIPAYLDTKTFYLPWTAIGDTFNVKGIVSVTSVNYNTGNLGTRMIRVSGAEDFVLTNNAKFMSATSTPSSVEQGATALFRVVGYPVRIATVTADLSAIGGGTITLPSDGTGGYAAKIRIPAATPVGDISIPVNVSNGGQTATGTGTITVVVRTPIAGDVNRSGGTPDVADVVAALKVAAGLTYGDDPMISVANGDVAPKGSPDGKLTISDALRILRAVRGLDTL